MYSLEEPVLDSRFRFGIGRVEKLAQDCAKLAVYWHSGRDRRSECNLGAVTPKKIDPGLESRLDFDSVAHILRIG